MSFNSILGNNKIKDFLNKSAESGKVSHSYLFVGIDGIGKELFAIEFARKLLCLNGEENEDCPSCIKLKTNNHPDFEIIENDSGSIKIDQIRNAQETIAQKPIVSSKKIYIIKDSDTMTIEAQNCLLKTLEEPPEYAIIILLSSNESKLLTTVKSRCMKINFETLSYDEIRTFIYKEFNQNVDDNLIKLCEGSIGKAIELQKNKDIYISINNLLDKIEKEDLIDFINDGDVLYKQKEMIKEILEYMNIYLYNSNKENCIKYVEDTKKRLLSNSNYDMTIDYLLIRMWEEVNEKYSRSSI